MFQVLQRCMIYATPEVTTPSQSPTFDDQGNDLQIFLFWKRRCLFFLSPTLLLVLLYTIPATSDTSKVVIKVMINCWMK
jgi:hypothetical protein